MRDSQAAETSKPPGMPIPRARRRSGFVRARDEASHGGAGRQRQPRSAWACPVAPASIAGAGPWALAPACVARLKPLGWSMSAGRAARGEARAPARGEPTCAGGALGRGRPRLPARGVGRTGRGAKHVAWTPGAQGARAGGAAAAPAQVVRHRCWQAGPSWAGGELGTGCTDDRAARLCRTPLATPGLPQAREAGVMGHAQRPQPVGAGGPRLPTLAWRAGPAVCLRGRGAVRTTSDVAAGALERGAGGRQAQARGGGGGQETGACRPPSGGQGRQGTPARVLVAMAGCEGRSEPARGGYAAKPAARGHAGG